MLFHPQPVSVMEDISDQTIGENQSATFECHIKINYPEITLTWYKGTQKLDKSNKYDIGNVGDRHYLRINNCQDKDQGNYRVVCGPHISNAKLTVTGKSLSVLSSSYICWTPVCLYVSSCPTGAGYKTGKQYASKLTHLWLTSLTLLVLHQHFFFCFVNLCFFLLFVLCVSFIFNFSLTQNTLIKASAQE